MTSPSVASHRADSPNRLRVAVLTISDTRTVDTDTSGALLLSLLQTAGHDVTHRLIVPDDPAEIRRQLVAFSRQLDLDAALLTGGTGISERDQTFEVVSSVLTRELPGFGEFFRMLSYQEIGPAAMLSRALGGLIDHLVVLAMPGSRAAVDLAMSRLVIPELPHLVREARRKT